MSPKDELLAFIDESGQRSKTPKSSDHFVMSAAIVRAGSLPDVSDLLAQLRIDTDRRPSDHLSWKNIRTHDQRLHIAKEIGKRPWLRVCSVIVCKRHLSSGIVNDDHAYLFTARFLLERLSWFGRQYDAARELHAGGDPTVPAREAA